ncbi:MAG: DUF3570 domain-containing protein [Steroidobacteraceae bacterium]|jgi:hypothetical protein|nr:DUF3570 domain-containing protein [Steroidobacteraceae bacterium]
MQLKNKRPIGGALASAACGLLGALPASKVHAEESQTWQVDSALLYYSEDDDRVRDVSLKAAIRRAFDEDRSLDIGLSVDTLTGASPSGAAPSDVVQTFTRPSGHGSYQIAAGAPPLDDTFRDTRIALSANWSQPLGERSRIALGVSGSSEYDYLHLGADARWERDFNQRNTTLFVGAAYGNERIDPVGGAPIPLAPMRGLDDPSSKRSTDSKHVVDGLIGLTQILSRRALLSLTYSYSMSDGYLNDPYKVLSVVDPNTGRPAAGPVGDGLGLYLYESRPDSRTKQSLYAEGRYALDRDSVRMSYRIMDDDWGVTSSTVEAAYRWNRTPYDYIEPQARYYTQSAADFYRTYLVDGAPLPQYASADYRLADLDAFTVGLKYGRRAAFGEYSVRLEYYRQTADAHDSGVGVLTGYDLIPPLTAFIVQFGYKFGF